MYVIYDHRTGDIIEKRRDMGKALERATVLDDMYAYINGHTFGVRFEHA